MRLRKANRKYHVQIFGLHVGHHLLPILEKEVGPIVVRELVH